MRATSLLALTACAAGCASSGGGAASSKATTPPAPAGFTPAQIAQNALPSVVLIKTATQLGTGFVVWQDGRIATNLHILAGSKQAEVQLNDGSKYDRIEVLAHDEAHDLAVIRIPARGLKALALGDSAAVTAGQHIVAIGHPLGLGNTVSDGLVSGIRELDPHVTLLQISAPISPGSSGGPIFNERGEVIGIATLLSTEGQNLNFGVPVSYLKPMLLAERGTPLGAFQSAMEVAILQGCSADDVRLTITDIQDAIKAGVPLFNNGDAQGCFDVYQKTSLRLVDSLKTCIGVRDTLLAGVSAANRAADVRDKAWAVRRAFDRILAAFTAAVEEGEKREQQQKP